MESHVHGLKDLILLRWQYSLNWSTDSVLSLSEHGWRFLSMTARCRWKQELLLGIMSHWGKASNHQWSLERKELNTRFLCFVPPPIFSSSEELLFIVTEMFPYKKVTKQGLWELWNLKCRLSHFCACLGGGSCSVYFGSHQLFRDLITNMIAYQSIMEIQNSKWSNFYNSICLYLKEDFDNVKIISAFILYALVSMSFCNLIEFCSCRLQGDDNK